MKPKVAFVVQRYGLDITGGSEALCRQVAERMLPHFDVEVLTTCATDHLSWNNVLPEGESTLNGVRVRRFPSRQERKLLEFHRIYDHIFDRQLTEQEEHEMLRHQGPYCPAMLDYIDRHRNVYGAFVFFTYLYWPVVNALPRVQEKSIFVPTAHDEASIYLHILDEVFRAARRFIFISEEERFFALRRFNLPEDAGRVIGMGIDEPQPGDPDPAWEPLRQKLEGARVLTYVGRVENGKGCDQLVDYFLRYVREEQRSDLRLLLIGRRTLPLPPHPQIVSPGFVSEYVKYHALEHTAIAVAPSPFESLCIAALESWMHRKPVLANGRCPVLVGHCRRSNGGLWYTSYAEFRECLRMLLADEELCRALGSQGRSYVEARYRWPVMEQAYREEIEAVLAPAEKEAAPLGLNSRI